MILEKIPKGAVPYMCENCGAVFLWSPDINDCGCGLFKKHEDEKRSSGVCLNCHFFEPLQNDKCPVCFDHRVHKISAIKYKFIRESRKR